jgi:hypothetical protein
VNRCWISKRRFTTPSLELFGQHRNRSPARFGRAQAAPIPPDGGCATLREHLRQLPGRHLVIDVAGLVPVVPKRSEVSQCGRRKSVDIDIGRHGPGLSLPTPGR